MKRRGIFFSAFPLIITFLFLCIISTNSSAQLNVVQGGTATVMAGTIVGPGVIVSNATINCPTQSFGTFSNGNTTNIGLTNGILLTTGNISQVSGPASNQLDFDNANSYADPDLIAIETKARKNSCILEFDIVPICDTLRLSYVFASEEYPDYVCSKFNDAFGFFISGPNPLGGNYTAKNIALIPGTSIAVSINSINNGTPGIASDTSCISTSFTSSFVPNWSGSSIAYNGFTVPLVASVPVTQCQTYHLKLAISDAKDQIYDSGVFLEQSGLNCPGTSVNIAAIADTAMEGCLNGSILITRGGDLTTTLAVNLTFSGTATNGTDYTLTNNVTFGTSQSSITLNIPTIADGNAEGVEIATITGSYAICGTTASIPPVTITIIEGPFVSFSSVSPGCGGNNGSITASPNSGNAPYTYLWSTSPPQSTATATGLAAGSYTVTVTDANNCSTDSAFVIGTTPSLNLSTTSTPVACNGGSNGTATVTASVGVTPYIYLWNTNPVQTTATATGLVAGNYSVTVSDNAGCQNNTTVAVNSQTALILTTSTTNVTCAGGNDGAASVSPSGGNTPYSYLWSNGGSGPGISLLSAGSYSVTVNDNNNCPSVTSITINDGVQNADATITQVGPFCNNDPQISLTAATPGGTFYGNGISGNTFSPASAGAGSHSIIYEINGLCGDADTVIIVVNAVPDPTINPVANMCTGNSSVALAAATSGGTWSGTAVSGNVFDPSISGAGIFTIIYNISISNCSASDSENVAVGQSMDASISPAGPFCTSDSPVSLSAVDAGGLWAGTGMAGNSFSPSTAGPGTHSITYTISGPCGDIDTLSIVVNAVPDPTISPVANLCTGNSPVTLTSVSPGGTWNGTGISGNVFDPYSSGAGTFSISYGITVAGCTASDSISITVNQSLNADISPAGPFCMSSPQVSLTGADAGGIWSGSGIVNSSTGAFDPAIAGNGSHVITYSINSACGDTDTVTIDVSNVSLDSSIIIIPSCNGLCDGSIMLNASGASQFSLDNGSTFQPSDTFNNLCAGIYTAKVQNSSGCWDTVPIAVLQPMPLSVNNFLAQPDTCFNLCQGYAVVIPSGGTVGSVSDYSYLWLPTGGSPPIGSGQNTASAGNLCKGTYNLVITDLKGCTKDTNFAITEPFQWFVTKTSNQTLCNGSCDGSANVGTLGGSSPFTYLWDSNAGFQATPTATGLCSGIFVVTVTDLSKCPVVDSVVVDQPSAVTVLVSPDVIICIDQDTLIFSNASGGAGDYSYLWDNGISISSQSVPAIQKCYTVTATDKNNCQSVPKTVCVDIYPVLNVTAASDAIICDDQPVNLDAIGTGGDGPPYTFIWNTGQTAANIIVNPSGNYLDTVFYSVVISDGCSPTDTDTVAIRFFQTPVPEINPISPIVCDGDTIIFASNVPNAISCEWNMGDGSFVNTCATFQYVYSDPANYIVDLTVVTTDGCTTTVSPKALVSVNPNPLAYFTYSPGDPTIAKPNVNFSDQSSGQITSWFWTFYNPGNNILDTSRNFDIEFVFPSDTGLYPVKLQVSTNYCTDDTILYVYVENEFAMYIPNSFTPNADGKNDFFFPKGIGINGEKFSFYIFDRWGDLIFESHNLNDPWDGTAREMGGTEIVKQDVYVWMVMAEEASKTPIKHPRIGHVTLLK